MISAIVAVDKNGGIGKKGDLLFLIPEDMSRFVSLTNGKRVIMGRKTFDSLGKRPLPNRINIIVTRDRSKVLESANRMLDALQNNNLDNVSDNEDANEILFNAYKDIVDENNALELWYSMNSVKSWIENEVKNDSVNIDSEVFVMGGGEIYKELLPYCDRIYLTEYNKDCNADTFFPDLNDDEWVLTEESEPKVHEGSEYKFITFDRVNTQE